MRQIEPREVAMNRNDDPSSYLIDAARGLAPKISAAGEWIEQERRLPDDIVEVLKEAGLFRMNVPRSLGGAEASLSTFAQVIEEVAKADASTAWCLSQNGGICRVAAYLPRAGAEEIFGQPDLTIGWGNGPASAVKVDGGYRLTGRWGFASGIRHAKWLGCQDCPILDAEGQPVIDDNGAPEKRIFFFPTADVTIQDVWQVSGLKGTGSESYSVTDLFVPAQRSPTPGSEPSEPGTLYRFNTTQIFSCGFASVGLGLARASLDAFIDLSVTKTPRGISGVLREMGTVQVHIAKAEATLRSARSFLHETIDNAWRAAEETGAVSVETRILLRLATTHALECAAKVVDTAYYNAGVTAIFNANGFERRFRDMHAATQHIQAREDHYEPVGQFFLGLEPSLVWL